MFFRFGITTVANTAETAKLKTVLKVAKGIITQIDIQFPSGPQGLLHIHLNDALHQLFPFNTGEDFSSDFVNITFRDHIPFLTEPFEIQAYTWNTDDTYDHAVIIRVGILPVHVAAPWLMPFDERIRALLGGV